MWIFGYGSLLWRPNFKYVAIKTGVVKGFARRFYQLSPDHRGTEENPGRTVTLVSECNSQTWGMAFKIPEEEIETTINYLNIREQAGYQLETVEFHPDDRSESFNLEVYISVNHPENIYYEPYASVELIVETVSVLFDIKEKPCHFKIINCHGKSGSNLEYALRLADVHRRFGSHVHDEHLFEIERRILQICEARRINDKILSVLGYKLPYSVTS